MFTGAFQRPGIDILAPRPRGITPINKYSKVARS